MSLECCWVREVVAPGECPNIDDGEFELCSSQPRRFLEKCIECHLFRRDLQQLQAEGNPLASLLPTLMSAYLDGRAQIHSMGTFLDTKTREISFLHDLSTVLQSSLDLDEVLSVAMTAITAGKGFGMNRAFLLMTDRERERLVGYLGVGPRDYEEARRIWEEVHLNDFSLRTMAHNFRRTKLLAEQYKFQDILERLSVPLQQEDHLFVRCLRERTTLLIQDAHGNPGACSGVGDILGVDSFLVMPLISRNRRIGIILADNFVTRRPITPQDIRSLETFAFPVAFALERASLYERLNEEVDKLTVANIRLHEQQELLVKMEQMALVGRITSTVAHSIRNPLMVIGGFARSLQKGNGDSEQQSRKLDSIVSEVRHLEKVLEEVLAYAESQYPVMDDWDMTPLLEGVAGEVRETLLARGVSLDLDLRQGLPAVPMDFKQIAHSIKTLILHSLSLNEAGGEIRVADRAFDEAVFVEILDRRYTLPPEQLESLAPPFSETEEMGRTGGLQLCRIIFERHGCDFHILSLPEGGTLYTLRFPVKKEGVHEQDSGGR